MLQYYLFFLILQFLFHSILDYHSNLNIIINNHNKIMTFIIIL